MKKIVLTILLFFIVSTSFAAGQFESKYNGTESLYAVAELLARTGHQSAELGVRMADFKDMADTLIRQSYRSYNSGEDVEAFVARVLARKAR